MADVHTLGRPYAKAVFSLANEQGKLAEWSQGLRQLSDAVTTPALSQLIAHPVVDRSVLAEVFGKSATGEMANLIRLLIENSRLNLAPVIAAEYEVLRAEAERRADVSVTTATAVDAAQQSQLTAAISKRLGQQIEVRWQVDPAVLGGARIQAGDLVIDGTLLGELDRLRAALTQS